MTQHLKNSAPSVGLFRLLLESLRAHQWVKNLLVFVPFFTGHEWSQPEVILTGVYGFFAFSLCASSAYLLNDWMDLSADRAHSTKRSRPLARGAISTQTALLLSALCLGSGLWVGFRLGHSLAFVKILISYSILTVAYSVFFKKYMACDVVILSILYTLRIIGGHAISGLHYSAWLLAFSMFLFLSLSLVKRFTELYRATESGKQVKGARGYVENDLSVLTSMGTSSGYIAVLVLALYINSEEMKLLYRDSKVLWLTCPLLLYWISRMWILAGRGLVNEDPVVFTLRDRVSWGVFFLVCICVYWNAIIV